MKPAPCSWRVITNSIGERESESRKSKFSSPGIPKTYSTPSASRAFTSKSDAFIELYDEAIAHLFRVARTKMIKKTKVIQRGKM